MDIDILKTTYNEDSHISYLEYKILFSNLYIEF